MSNHVLDEAKRCLQCKEPQCQKGCPASMNIREVIRLFKENRIEDAGDVLFRNNPLSLVCSYVCPQESQCEGHCVLGKKSSPVQFSIIENYISDYYLNIFDRRSSFRRKRTVSAPR